MQLNILWWSCYTHLWIVIVVRDPRFSQFHQVWEAHWLHCMCEKFPFHGLKTTVNWYCDFIFLWFSSSLFTHSWRPSYTWETSTWVHIVEFYCISVVRRGSVMWTKQAVSPCVTSLILHSYRSLSTHSYRSRSTHSYRSLSTHSYRSRSTHSAVHCSSCTRSPLVAYNK